MFVLSLFLPQGHAVGEGVTDLVRCNDENGLGIPWGIDTLPLPVLYWGQFANERKRPIMAEILDIVDEQGRPTDQDILAGTAMPIENFVKAIQKACENADKPVN